MGLHGPGAGMGHEPANWRAQPWLVGGSSMGTWPSTCLKALQDLPGWNRMGDRTLQHPGAPPHLDTAVHARGWLFQSRIQGYESPFSARHQPHSTTRKGFMVVTYIAVLA